MTPLKNREDELRKPARRDAALSGDEAADLRRLVADLQGSLSWRITAPLRFIAKPLFRVKEPRVKEPRAKEPHVKEPRARALKTVPLAEIHPGPAGESVTGESVTGESVTNFPAKNHGSGMTKLDAVDTLATPTLGAVCNWYGIPPKFAHAALETFVGADYDRNIADIHEFLARYERHRIQLDYTFSTNTRGRNLAKQLEGWGVPVGANVGDSGEPPKSYLDVGFAYGGSLAAFASLGYDVTGVEISEKLAMMGRLNLESSSHAVDTRIGDFLSDVILPDERKFDLITCCDVIEHVMDPETALRKICRLLKPGGMAYIAYPTKLSIPYVRADAHAQLFGLTLLDYYRARTAYTMYTGWPDFEVSDFYEPEWYLNTARSAGVQAELVYDSSLAPPDVPGEIAALYAAFSEWTRSGAQKLDPLMRHEITRELANYSARMFQEYSRHVAHNSVDQFARKWIDQLTRILIRKPSA